MRVVRPLLWFVVAAGAAAAFVALGELSEVPVRWDDVGGWLDEVSLEVALVELARWVGLALSVYVAVVSALVVLGELAALVRVVPAARLLRGAAGLVAVPALRRRLVEASTATAVTVSAMSVSAGGGVLAAAPAAAQPVDVDATSGLPEAIDLDPAVEGTALSVHAAAAPGVTGEVRRVVAPGDTVWELAVSVYGFCNDRVVGLVAAASNLEDPNVIYAGQVLVFPALSAEMAAPAVASDGAATWSTRMVVAGDTLWVILHAAYGFVDADLVWSYAGWAGLEDPSEIPVGTPLTLPPLSVLTGEPVPALSPPPPGPSPAPAVAEAVAPVVAETAPPALPTPPAVSDGAMASEAEERPRFTPSPTSSSAVAGPVREAAPVIGSVGEGGVGLPAWLVGVAGATTLSVGLLGVYRRLRRRQGSAGARAWRLMPSGESARLYRQLVAAADVPLVRWAGQELSEVLFGLGRPAAGPVAVELSDLTGVELLWDAPMPAAPAPWEATPAGWSWRLLYDPAAEVPESVLPAAVPGLVTLGRRDDVQVLVDLEAFGSMAITGEPRAAEDVLRSVVLELGAGDELSDAFVSTVGLGIDGVEHLSRVLARSGEQALRHAQGVVADVRRVMDDAGVDGTFVLRASGPATSREVTVIALRADAGEVVGELVGLATPRSGLAVVVLGDVEGAGLRAVVDGAGAMKLVPLGIELRAVGVGLEAAANTAVLLEAAAAHVVVGDLPDDDQADIEAAVAVEATVDGDVDAVAAGDGAGPVAAEVAALCGPEGIDLDAAGELLGGDEPVEGWVRPEPALLVRVLGRPHLEPEPEGLPRFERLMAVFVASTGGDAPAGAVRDAVWGGKLVADKRFWNVVSELRSRLGSSVCPARPAGSDRVRLVDTLTDLQLLEAMVAEARQLPSSAALPLLLDALGLVDGEPFDDAGYEWAIERQLTFRAAELIESAALRAVELALSADDVVSARQAVSQALVGLPGNEVLYRARMRIEHHANNLAGVRSVYAELRSVLQELAGDTVDGGDPSPATRQLLEELTAGGRSG